MSNLDSYRQTLQSMGLNEIMTVMQAAVDRYEAR